jgi:hypothetical protein
MNGGRMALYRKKLTDYKWVKPLNAIISDRNLQAFHYNVVAFGKQGHFAKPLQIGTRIKLVVQAQSQPDNIATLPLLTATFVRPVRPYPSG